MEDIGSTAASSEKGSLQRENEAVPTKKNKTRDMLHGPDQKYSTCDANMRREVLTTL
jgi:hypothetical protein